MEDANEIKVCEIGEAVDERDERAGFEAATLQAKVRDGVLKSGVYQGFNLTERWEVP